MESQNSDVERESTKALDRQFTMFEQLHVIQLIKSTLSTLKLWCKDFNTSGTAPEQQGHFKTAGVIIENRLTYLEDGFKAAEGRARAALSMTQAYKQSVNPAETHLLHTPTDKRDSWKFGMRSSTIN